MGYNSYYLYQKYITIGDQPPVPFYPETYSVSGDSENPMPLVLKEENSVECGYTGASYRWHQLPITESSTCSAGTKYYVDIYQVSYDGGLSWQNVVPTTTRTGAVYQTGSSDCIEYRWATKPITEDYICDTCPPVQPIYRWVNMDISTDYVCDECTVPPTPTPQYRTLTTATTCIGYDKYVLEEYQVSYDSGVTWTTTGTSATTLIEADSEDCGYVPPTPTFKWKATYTGGSVTTAECDASSAITTNEITYTNLQSVVIGDCVTSIGESAFGYCGSLTSVTIGNGVTSIGNYAFSNCSGLTSVTIHNSVTSIGNGAFYDCSGLTSVTIPNSVTSIGYDAFRNCRSLTSLTIGSGIASIGSGAFYGCRNLTSVTVNATTPPTLGSNAFSSTNNYPIYVPASSVNAYKSASGWSSYASRIQAIP